MTVASPRRARYHREVGVVAAVLVAAVLVAGSEKAAAHRLGLSHSTVKHAASGSMSPREPQLDNRTLDPHGLETTRRVIHVSLDEPASHNPGGLLPGRPGRAGLPNRDRANRTGARVGPS
jgi:hypothetical protein